MRDLNNTIEGMRFDFLNKFSPEKLAEMSGTELLSQVFGNNDSCMIRILMRNPLYRWFGACGTYSYLGIIYYTADKTWVYKEGKHSTSITEQEAEQKALMIRDMLLECTECIRTIGFFQNISCYELLEQQISHVFFYQYTWVLKYFQMVFPYVFPAMYDDGGANQTILRAIKILGLRNHGNTKRLLNVGEISLFIRRCDINNIVFTTRKTNKSGSR